VEELLSGAGMSGFLGVLDPPARTARLESLLREVDNRAHKREVTEAAGERLVPTSRKSSEISVRVASVVGKVEALTELLQAAAKKTR
jgi:hypothetical protein